MSAKPLDFLLVGAVKAGTTTLFELLRYHPSIYIPAGKEVYFFDNQERLALGWDHFAAEFYSGAAPGQKWGKITPRYLNDHEAPAAIAALAPDVRLLALLRNPVDRAISHYRMVIRRRPDYALTFDQLVAEALPASPVDKPAAKYPNIWSYGAYGANFERYLRYFQQQQILAMFTDDLELRPQFVLDSVLEHIGLEPGYRPDNLGRAYHSGGKQRFPRLVPFVRQQLKPAWRLLTRLPEHRKEALKSWYAMRLNLVPQPAPQQDPVTRQRLIDFYRPDVRKLESILGKRVPWVDFQ